MFENNTVVWMRTVVVNVLENKVTSFLSFTLTPKLNFERRSVYMKENIRPFVTLWSFENQFKSDYKLVFDQLEETKNTFSLNQWF